MNIEGLTEWEIPEVDYRELGLSAMLRVKDEAEYLPAAIRSIYPWCDEIVIAVQGEQSDHTAQIAESWAELDKVRTIYYPFDSVPNGPGHGDQPRGSVYERAYFYNWTMAHCRRRHVMKWDGDMVATDDAGSVIKAAINAGSEGVRFKGVEIVDADKMLQSAIHPYANTETRVFVAEKVYYATGPACEILRGQNRLEGQVEIEHPLYLHFKWAKSEASATKAWPENWREKAHFKRIYQRSKPGEQYTGPIPSCL